MPSSWKFSLGFIHCLHICESIMYFISFPSVKLCWTIEWRTFILACHSKSSQGFPSETKSLCLENPFPMGKRPSSTSTLIIQIPWLPWVGGISALKGRSKQWSNQKLRVQETTTLEVLDGERWHIKHHIRLWACSLLREIRCTKQYCQLIKVIKMVINLFFRAFQGGVQNLESKLNL